MVQPLSHGVSGLPRPLTRFVGRERESQEVRELLRRVRLLSLTGAGGSGKTRLALAVVGSAQEDFPGGAVWVDLSTLNAPDLLVSRVAAAMGLTGGSAVGSRENLPTDLAGRPPTLLVLDSCEHLVEACAELTQGLLDGAPDLHILVTSREALGVAGEHAWHVPPLSVPNEAPASVEELLRSESALLFLDRARAARAEFELTEENLEPVASICRRLDGMPLAIELAAARIRVLSAGQVAQRLDRAFRLLTEGSRTAVPRHRTLRSAMDWSYGLLPEEERAFLPRLSVFRGTFSLSAAEEVCAEPDADPFAVFETIAHLVDRSLVEVREARGAVRYHLLETVRQYAAEKLEEDGSAHWQARHARFFLDLAHEAEPFLTTARRREWVERLVLDLDNLRQALAWSRDHEPEVHAELAGSLCWFWFSSGFWVEGRQWLEEALDHLERDVRSASRGRLLFGAGVLACLQGLPGLARSWLEESADIARGLRDSRSEAYALSYLGMALAQEGRSDGREPVQRALARFRESEDQYGCRLALLVSAILAMNGGETNEAEQHALEAVSVARGFGQDREMGIALQVLAHVALDRKETERALALLRESLQTLRRDPLDMFVARALEAVAVIGCDRDQWETGIRLAGAAEAIRSGLGAQPFGIDRPGLDSLLQRGRARLGGEPFERLLRQGRETPLAAAIDLALSMDVDVPDGAARTAGPAGVEDRPAPSLVLPDAPGPPPALEVLALGPLEVRREGIPLGPDAWRLQKPRELLVFLLSYPNGRAREQIGAAFWPDASPPHVKNSFHVTLHHLRKALGGTDRVVIDGDRYRINPDLDVRFDVEEFERAAGREGPRGARPGPDPAELQRAVALYRGEFLEGEKAGAWHHDQRDRLRNLYVELLLDLSSVLLGDGRLEECLDVAERAIRTDDLREDAYRTLLTCLARMGRTDEALRRYDHLVRFLREAVDSEPEKATQLLAASIQGGTVEARERAGQE